MTFQNDLDVLSTAISETRLVYFRYESKKGVDEIPRRFEPYAVFSRTTQTDGLKYFVDGRQWSGDSSSATSQWKYRQFEVINILPGITLGEKIKDSKAPYNPDSDLYENALIKREG